MTELLEKFKDNVEILNEIKLNDTSKEIIYKIYDEIIDLENEHKTIKRKIHPTVTEINNTKQIPQSRLFNGIPDDIKDYILDEATYKIEYSVKYNKELVLNITFIIFEKECNIIKYNDYMKFIALWINYCVDNATRKCAKYQNFYIYLTPLKKSIPYNKDQIFTRLSSNTGHTNGCVGTSTIVIYRYEEWVKVFIHETFHSFGMDFNQLNRGVYFRKIKRLLNIDVDVKFYEAYCEIWCKIINCIFKAISMIKFDKVKQISDREKLKQKDKFFRCFTKLFNIELSFAIFQGVKMLDHSRLTYENLYNKDKKNLEYFEVTNILAYHVITPAFIFSLNEFLEWSKTNNINYIQFNQTQQNILDFFDLYRKVYCNRKLMATFKKYEKIKQKINDIDLLMTGRMTIIE